MLIKPTMSDGEPPPPEKNVPLPGCGDDGAVGVSEPVEVGGGGGGSPLAAKTAATAGVWNGPGRGEDSGNIDGGREDGLTHCEVCYIAHARLEVLRRE